MDTKKVTRDTRGARAWRRKTIDAFASIHTAQLRTYLRFFGLRSGYLINFNTLRLKDGFRRLGL